MKTKNLNEKNIIISSRISQSTNKKLEEISKRKKIPISTTVNQILERYTKFVDKRLDRGDILIPKLIFNELLTNSSDEELLKIASKYIPQQISFFKTQHEELDFKIMDEEYRNFHEYNFLNLTVFEHENYNIYKSHHNFGKGFSKLFSVIDKGLFESQNCSVLDLEINEHYYSFKVKHGQHPKP